MQRRYTQLMLSAGLLLWGGLLLLLWLRPVPTVDAQVGETRIQFSAERGVLLFPNECVTVRWDVFGTLGVKLNGELLPTPGVQAVCSDAAPVLTVILPDSQEVSYTLDVWVLSRSGLLLGLMVLATGLVVWGGLGLLGKSLRLGDFWSDESIGRLAKWVLVNLLVLGAFWALIDVGLRWYFNTYGNQAQKIMFLYSVEEIRRQTSNLIHVPYVSYLANPEYEGHNALGYRGAEISAAKPAGGFRIVALGGSTTYSTGTSAEEAYPALLQNILREQYGYSQVEVINAGFPGYTSWEALATFAFRALELEPDMFIYYEAVNDLVVRERSNRDCYAGENPMRGLNPARGLFVERTTAYPSSTLLRFIGISLGQLPNPLALESAFEPTLIDCWGQSDDTLESRLEANDLRYYTRNLKNLVLLARGNGAQAVFSTWAYNVQAERPQLWRDEIARHNAALSDLAAELEVPLIDLAADFPVDSALWEADGIHMLAGGTQAQAERYAAFLDEAGLIRQP